MAFFIYNKRSYNIPLVSSSPDNHYYLSNLLVNVTVLLILKEDSWVNA